MAVARNTAYRMCAIARAAARNATPLAREVADSSNRKVEVPDRVERTMGTRPRASVMIYALAPEKLIVKRAAEEAYLPFLSPLVRNLPEFGRLTRGGDTANLETVMSTN
jgi:iron complex transport system substrate-binding protein